jgi:hypothetical protein
LGPQIEVSVIATAPVLVRCRVIWTRSARVTGASVPLQRKRGDRRRHCVTVGPRASAAPTNQPD